MTRVRKSTSILNTTSNTLYSSDTYPKIRKTNSKMGKKDNLFFLIRQGWDINKIAIIIDSKAYRTLGGYPLWEKKEDIEQLNTAIAKGNLLFEGQDKNLLISIDIISQMSVTTNKRYVRISC
ncbi:hypothetical protein L211DRAFT_854429 [Terfezia boudieri ATCC MYA-4762]|uniref:Uncharacterized protein n=1 Tax=Terfezia boudieri ATCC MYA-4762 TaxID=1051890 RepID=A0A3N4L5G4_9PEZI|nr:hypothetical protein L211DRAFT_854429 [Terfezia boudieri ATCC MYA-4762]